MLSGILSSFTRQRRDRRAATHLERAVLARDAGSLDEAEREAQAALTASPASADARLLLSDIALRRGDLAAAEAHAKTVLRAQPDHPDALQFVIGVRRRQGRSQDVERLLLRLLEVAPERLDARIDLAALLIERGRHAKAAALLEYVLKRAPDLALAHGNLALARHLLGQHEAAERHFREALRLAPDDESTRDNFMLCLRDRGDLDGAIAVLRESAARKPPSMRTRVILASVLRDAGRTAEALQVLEEAPNDDGDHAAEHAATLAKLRQDCGNYAAASAAHDRAVRLRPDASDLRLTRALHLLALGNFAEGWTEYAHRLTSSESPRRAFPVPHWSGEPVAGRHVLVYAEQGLGDEIMFASCLPDLAAEASRVVVECDPRLARLFAHSFPDLAVFAGRHRAEHPWLEAAGSLDFAIPAGSLPGLYRRSVEAFPGRAYLRAPPERVALQRARLARIGGGPWIGITWRGGIGRTRQAVRSLEANRMVEALRGGGRRFVSLQHGVQPGEVEGCGGALHHWPEVLSDAMEQAALMAALDATVTVCNTTVHLGGALGLPVFVLVPSGPEWRYRYEGERMPWYGSVRLLRQRTPGEWAEPLARAAQALVERQC